MLDPRVAIPQFLHSHRVIALLFQPLYLSAIVLFLCSALVTYRIFLHPLRNIPGPGWARVTELWRTRKYTQGRWHDDILELHRRYGPVVRVAPNEVSFVDPEALNKVYGHTTGTKKTSWYNVWSFTESGSSVFATTDPKTHAFLRKRVAAAYSMSTMLSLEDKIQTVADSLWIKFREIARAGSIIDLQQWTLYFAHDVVYKLGLGEPVGMVQNGRDVNNLLSLVHDIFFLRSSSGNLPGQQFLFENVFVQRISKFLGNDASNKGPAFNEWLVDKIFKRMAEVDRKDRTPDMLDYFISMKEANGQPATLPSILGETGSLSGAGGDTTAVAIAVVMGQLLMHPEECRKARDEVDAMYDQPATSDNWQLDYRAAANLPWLSACIKEATRLCPSIVYQLPREAPAEGIVIAGHYVPSSATLSMSAIAHNRCREIYGDDADDFRPSRWIVGQNGVTREQVHRMDKHNVLFGYGTRVCVGRHLATIEVHKFVGQFLRHFECELADKTTPFIRRSLWFCLQEKLFVRIRERCHTTQSLDSEP